MKKKLFLMSLIMVAFACIFAISAFADDIIAQKTESAEYGTVIRLNADPGLDNAKQYVSTLNKINDAGTDKDALCILTDGDAENPSYYVFPASYVVLERADGKFDLYGGTDAEPGLAQAMAEFNAAMGTKYYSAYATTGTYGDKRIANMVAFEFTKDVTFVADNWCCMRYCYSLVEVRFNYPINLSSAGSMFKNSNKLTTVVGFENADPNLAKSMFYGCTSLESVSLPTGTTKIPQAMFWGCRELTITNLAELTQLTTIGPSAFQDSMHLNFVLPDTVTTIEANAFQSAFKDGNGGSFVINKTSQLTTIGNSAFEDCRLMPASIYIPSTVTSIGTKAFTKCYTLQTLENFENCQITTIEDGTFSYASALKTLKIPATVTTIGKAFDDNNNLTLVYIPKSVTSVANTFTGGKPANAVYIYTGKDASVFADCAKLAGAKVVKASEYDATATYTGINLVVGYSHCVAYNGGVHGESVVDTIVTSYTQPIKVVNKCTLCEMTDESGRIAALFTYRGFSTQEKGGNSIVIGFTSNSAAISEYEKIAGKTLKYGVFAVSRKKLGDSLVFGENGAVSSGVINADLTNSDFAMFDLKLTGFNADNMDDKLAIGAYVIATDENGTEYSYLQDSTKGALDGAYYFASYNEMVA